MMKKVMDLWHKRQYKKICFGSPVEPPFQSAFSQYLNGERPIYEQTNGKPLQWNWLLGSFYLGVQQCLF